MSDPGAGPRLQAAEVFERALDARDPRFDGVFFVGIVSTGIYCRPVCPARVSHPEHRRFFSSAAAAERSGFRPCLRCRPELAPGRARVDAVPRLADTAARRIEAGALNGHTVAELADELSVSARHLRRAMRREVGVSPVELAQTHRLLLAKRLLADTTLQVGRIAHASGFQSVRRFNAVFRERYRMSPSDVRRGERNGGRPTGSATPSTDAEYDSPIAPAEDVLHLTLAYRAPLAWESLIHLLDCDALAGVEGVEGRRYGRTVRLNGQVGVVFAEADNRADDGDNQPGQLRVDVSMSLLPALMPLLAGLRRLFDLDAEPETVDDHLRRGGLGDCIDRRPGLRLPGAIDGFEVAFKALLRNSARWSGRADGLMRRVTAALGEPFATGVPSLNRLPPGADAVARAGEIGLVELGVPRRRAAALAEVAQRIVNGSLRLEPGGNAAATRRALLAIDGIGDRLATTIVMRAGQWPDAFPFSDPALLRAARAENRRALRERARAWRPWRAYAAVHLWLVVSHVTRLPSE